MDDQHYHATKVIIISLPIGKDDDSVILRVQKQKVDDVIYRIGRKAPMSRLMLDYCVRVCPVYGTINFCFSFNGKTLSTNSTADDLALVDGDIIDAWTHPMGGWLMSSMNS
ncbi:Rad60-SLD domain-containing protein [Cephalotus follicularis]|uniref:Rad60-SLD domain-containing protein n=1 Tax=Cephalotus follicularis TaxID=3775 RepID=A0A1Q3CVT3_CEPFO|nr:Rad60-SLD domain-containing protein [Cephalotus follicularis]